MREISESTKARQLVSWTEITATENAAGQHSVILLFVSSEDLFYKALEREGQGTENPHAHSHHLERREHHPVAGFLSLGR